MIARLTGTVAGLRGESLVLEVVGVGYKVGVPVNLRQSLTEGQNISLEIAMQWNRGEPVLYGFAGIGDLELFERLLRVPGVGAKGALRAVGGGAELVSAAINTGDTAELAKISGLSGKLAAKTILELKGKLNASEGGISPGEAGSPVEKAVQAIIGYGFGEVEVRQAVAEARLAGPEADLPTLISRVLKNLAPPARPR